MSKPVTMADRLYAFRKATNSMAGCRDRWAERALSGLTDEQLAKALEYEMGIYCGAGGPDSLDWECQGAGLKIWASWDGLSRYKCPPLFEGAATVRMAREVYGIKDPSVPQGSLF